MARYAADLNLFWCKVADEQMTAAGFGQATLGDKSDEYNKSHIQRNLDFLRRIITEDFDQIWEKGFARSIRNYPEMKVFYRNVQRNVNHLARISTDWIERFQKNFRE